MPALFRIAVVVAAIGIAIPGRARAGEWNFQTQIVRFSPANAALDDSAKATLRFVQLQMLASPGFRVVIDYPNGPAAAIGRSHGNAVKNFLTDSLQIDAARLTLKPAATLSPGRVRLRMPYEYEAD